MHAQFLNNFSIFVHFHIILKKKKPFETCVTKPPVPEVFAGGTERGTCGWGNWSEVHGEPGPL